MDGKLNETTAILREIVDRFGTPTYAFDVGRMQGQVDKLRRLLPASVDFHYSLKANASLGICNVFADSGIGADVASAGEFATAVAAGFAPAQIFVAGPFKLPETIAQLRQSPEAVVSIDSPSELNALSALGLTNRAVLRLRPDFGSCAVVQAGSESRFGFTCNDLARVTGMLPDVSLDVIGFHIFAGSQVLDADKLIGHLSRSFDLAMRAAETVKIDPTLINLGGGFGIPYGPNDGELDIERVAAELHRLAGLAGETRLILELGRYLVAEAGWYLTSVVGTQTFQGRPAVIVDGGVHQRADMCGLCLRKNQYAPLVVGSATGPVQPTDILGCLSLPDDVLLESCELPPLEPGTPLAFRHAGAYGIWSSAAIFHGSPLPVEVAFAGSSIQVMRERRPATSILEDQHHVTLAREVATV